MPARCAVQPPKSALCDVFVFVRSRVYDSDVDTAMATHRLTSAERQLIRAARSAHKRRHVSPHRGGLAEHAFDAAKGDPWLALDLAIEVTRKRLDIEWTTWEAKPARRHAPTRGRISYEELMKSAQCAN